MTANDTEQKDAKAWAVSIEVDGRQKYLFETDKLQEMVGASAIMRALAGRARHLEQDSRVHVFQPASGEVRAWSVDRTALLRFSWQLREWLTERGVEHTAVLLSCRKDHFVCDRSEQGDASSAAQPGEATLVPREPDCPNLSWVHQALSELARRVKNAKPGSDARPVCSLFESCRIHGLDFANEWDPKQEDEEAGTARDRRRALRGFRARAKFDARQSDRIRFIDEDVRRPLHERSKELLSDPSTADQVGEDPCAELRQWVSEHLRTDDRGSSHDRAITIGNLALDPTEWFDSSDTRSDQFVGFICADGDGMGRLLTGLNWNTPEWADQADTHGFGKMEPWERNRRFSTELDHVVRDAFRSAVADVTLRGVKALQRLYRAATKSGRERFVIPVLPQLLGGDDLWTIARKDVALPLCRNFAKRVQDGIPRCPILRRAMELSEKPLQETAVQSDEDAERSGSMGRCRPARRQPERLTMSLGVAFAKAGHPVHAMIEAAESLLDSAKRLRKGHEWNRGCAPDEGCLDWHWIESSLSETVEEARAAGAAYVAPDTGDVMLLTTRPWTQTQAERFEHAAELFRAAVPRRKREQLDGILRRGHVVSLVAWEAWWSRLRDDERCAVTKASEALDEQWRLPSPGDDRAGREAKQWKHLQVSPWVYRGAAKNGDQTQHYYVTPLLDFLALDNLAAPAGEITDDDPEGTRPAGAADG